MSGFSLAFALVSVVLAALSVCLLFVPRGADGQREAGARSRLSPGVFALVFAGLWLLSCLLVPHPPWLTSTFTLFVLVLLYSLSVLLEGEDRRADVPATQTVSAAGIEQIDMDAWSRSFDALLAAGRYAGARASLLELRRRVAAAPVHTPRQREIQWRIVELMVEASRRLDRADGGGVSL
ncbi:hypothetical protein IHV25_00605 [Phaeovibrio sulfidiphilus]|uniref:Uncharacterized protein n=1 Tax=Phaeovibrio sulfidiphilus TaxID=1220600 RepID=A0A8J6YLU3_9PROT|nr:hypothetical protein [Phaeovibrio sulfidiphilus]MBE1236159.1 hypothetical protein [Phaeovibrio sulfidiphilus]